MAFNFLKKAAPAKTLESREKVVIPGERSPALHGVRGEAQPGIQSHSGRDSKNSGFRRLPRTQSAVHRNGGVIGSCRSPKRNEIVMKIEELRENRKTVKEKEVAVVEGGLLYGGSITLKRVRASHFMLLGRS
jgi:hypothetical protein